MEGRSGLPNSLQRLLSASCTQRTPAGLPFGIPGMGDEMDMAMQQAPQALHSIFFPFPASRSVASEDREFAVDRGPDSEATVAFDAGMIVGAD